MVIMGSDSSSAYLISRLLREHVKPHVGRLIQAAICMILAAAATAGHAWMMQPVLDKIFLEKNTSMLLYVPLGVFLVGLVKGAASYGQTVTMRYVGQRIVTDMQIRLYAHLLHADIATFGANSSGRLISRFSNDINIMRGSVSNVLTGIARESLTLIFLIALMFYQSWQLAIIAFIVFPVAILPIIRLGKRMRKISNTTQDKLGHFTSRLDETFQGVKVVKAYNREAYEIERANSMMEHIFKLYVKAAKTDSISSPVMESLSAIAIAAVVWYGGAQVIAGTTTPGAFFSFITALIMAYKPMKSLSSLNSSLQEGLAAAKRLFAMLDVEPVIKDSADAKPLTLQGGAIQFDNVQFSYESTKLALKDVSFTVPAGKTVALVGASGGGKSTIMQLVQRFYDPESGAISIDGQDIRNVTLSSLRESMAIVSQEITLFDDTVRANICYGKLDATEEEMIEAAKQAAAHDFIMELPEGYDTVIGQHGLKISGGQRQRIAIARAMLKNAPILLLDEATSALDTVSEQKIKQALEVLMKGRTTLVIAHRLSTIINADIIHVLDKGSIVESGSHQELLHMQGVYTMLYSQQHDRTVSLDLSS